MATITLGADAVIREVYDPNTQSLKTTGTSTVAGAVNLSMQPLKTVYGESTVSSGAEVVVLTYTVPAGKTGYLQSISVSGETIATYTLFHGLNKFAVRRTSYGPGFDLTFDFTPSGAAGVAFAEDEQLKVSVLNNGASPGLFNINAQVIEV